MSLRRTDARALTAARISGHALGGGHILIGDDGEVREIPEGGVLPLSWGMLQYTSLADRTRRRKIVTVFTVRETGWAVYYGGYWSLKRSDLGLARYRFRTREAAVAWLRRPLRQSKLEVHSCP